MESLGAIRDWVVFEGASHRANVERPAEYARFLAVIAAATGMEP